jgi:hypothetical protein
LLLLVATIVLLFALVLGFGLLLFPRKERQSASLSTEDARLDACRLNGFRLLQIAPTSRMTQAEFVFLDGYQRELGRYIGEGRRSATISYAGGTVRLYIQGSGRNRTKYSGKIGGTSDNSIVIRDDQRVLAEIWRQNALPPIVYRFVCPSQTLRIVTAGWRPTSTGSITREDGGQVATFRRPSLLARNVFVAIQPELSDELKVLLCSILVLQ